MIQTFTEILNEMCDAFDSYIAPKKIRRDNTNFIYLILKATAKGYEIIVNVVEHLRGKFNPAVCQDADLESIAKIAGTKRIEGTGSGLIIEAVNYGIEAVTIYAGDYEYQYDDSVKYVATLTIDTELQPSESVQLTAFTDVKGSYPVTDMSNMRIRRSDESIISPDIVFSCQNNEELLGSLDESTLDFRRRILNDHTRQDSIKELEMTIRNLPYIFDCKLVFNQTDDIVSYGGIDVPPYHLLINLNGDPREEIASIVASRTVYPTVEVLPSQRLVYRSDIFIGGEYNVFYNRFSELEYGVSIKFKYNPQIITYEAIQGAINAALNRFRFNKKHYDVVTEAEFYNAVLEANLPSLRVLDVNILLDSVPVPYIEVLAINIPKLSNVILDGEIM